MAIVNDDIRGERVFMKIADQRPNLVPHALAYALALPYVQGKKVLEIGCGTGYGTKLLAEAAEHIIGIDYSQTAISYAAEWKPDNCKFLCKDAEVDLPILGYEPDVIVAMQALEHLDNPKALIERYQGCTWVFALPHGGESVEHHHYSVDERLIQTWFSGTAQLKYFRDDGCLIANPFDDFTNYFGVYNV